MQAKGKLIVLLQIIASVLMQRCFKEVKIILNYLNNEILTIANVSTNDSGKGF